MLRDWRKYISIFCAAISYSEVKDSSVSAINLSNSAWINGSLFASSLLSNSIGIIEFCKYDFKYL